MEQKENSHSFWLLLVSKKCKRGLDHHFLCWVDLRQTSVDDSLTAIFPKTRHFCNVNLFLMSLIFLFLLLLLLFFFTLQNLYFAKVPLLLRQITHRLWSAQSTDTDVPLWNL